MNGLAHLGVLGALAAATAAAAPAPGMAPNPSRGNAGEALGSGPFLLEMLMFPGTALLPPNPSLAVLFARSSASFSFLAFSSASSRALSYPSCLILSASARALRSASAKSTGLVFWAPNPSLDFFAAVVVPRPEEEEEAEVKREAPSPEREPARMEEDEVVLGAGALGAAAGAVEAGDDVARPMMGGVLVRGVPGAEVLGVAGLDQDSKKSSSVS